MMRQRVLVTVAAIMACAGCSVTVGSGPVRTETRQVSGFSVVRLSGQGDVRIVRGSTESLEISAQENLLPQLTSEVSGGTLTLGTKDGTTITTTEPITYAVGVRDLQGLELSGSGTMTAAGLSGPALRVEISGSGEVRVDGTVDRQDVEVSGSGSYTAASLASKEATVRISGSGAADLAVSSLLDVDVSGSGSVAYSGDAKVTQSVSGSGSVSRR
jgi:hypothetical protein